MKTLAALMVCGLVSGCAWSGVEKIAPDGSRIRAFNTRFVWSTEGFELTYPTTNGNIVIKLNKSNPHAETVGAAVEGAVKGMK